MGVEGGLCEQLSLCQGETVWSFTQSSLVSSSTLPGQELLTSTKSVSSASQGMTATLLCLYASPGQAPSPAPSCAPAYC